MSTVNDKEGSQEHLPSSFFIRFALGPMKLNIHGSDDAIVLALLIRALIIIVIPSGLSLFPHLMGSPRWFSLSCGAIGLVIALALIAVPGWKTLGIRPRTRSQQKEAPSANARPSQDFSREALSGDVRDPSQGHGSSGLPRSLLSRRKRLLTRPPCLRRLLSENDRTSDEV
jgi:hypothetical protein